MAEQVLWQDARKDKLPIKVWFTHDSKGFAYLRSFWNETTGNVDRPAHKQPRAHRTFMCFSVLALMSFTVNFDRAYPTMNVFLGNSWSRYSHHNVG